MSALLTSWYNMCRALDDVPEDMMTLVGCAASYLNKSNCFWLAAAAGELEMMAALETYGTDGGGGGAQIALQLEHVEALVQGTSQGNTPQAIATAQELWCVCSGVWGLTPGEGAAT